MKWAKKNAVEWHCINPGKPQQKRYIDSFSGSLCDEFLKEKIFDSMANARRNLAIRRQDDNNARPHSSLGNRSPANAGRALQLLGAKVPSALTQAAIQNYHTQGLSS